MFDAFAEPHRRDLHLEQLDAITVDNSSTDNPSTIIKPKLFICGCHFTQSYNTDTQHNNHIQPTMSGAANGTSQTTKAVVSDSKDSSQPLAPPKVAAQLEEDDEFEDFPVEGKSAPPYPSLSTLGGRDIETAKRS